MPSFPDSIVSTSKVFPLNEASEGPLPNWCASEHGLRQPQFYSTYCSIENQQEQNRGTLRLKTTVAAPVERRRSIKF